MFFQSLKKKSLKRNIHKLLQSGEGPTSSSQLKTAGILVDHTAFKDVSALKQMLQDISSGLNYEVLIYVKSLKEEETLVGDKFSEKSVSNTGKIKDPVVKSFIEKPFDFLVSYYSTENLPLQLITASSAAKFKVGLPTDIDVNDLVLNVVVGDLSTFKSELLKYLKILNRID